MKQSIVAIMLLFCASAQAIVGGTEPPTTDTTYDAVGAFAVTWRLGLTENPGDPAAGPHNWYCAATLVRDGCTIVTARHCVDAYGEAQPHAVRFRRKPDGTVGSVEAGVHSFYHATIESFYVPGAGDVAIGRLSQCVTHITPRQIDFSPVALYEKLDVAGWGKEGPGQNEGSVRRLRVCATWATQSWYNQVFFPDAWQTSGPNCGPNNNDSGGPVMRGGCVIGPTLSYGSGMPLSYYANDSQIKELGLFGCGNTDPAIRK